MTPGSVPFQISCLASDRGDSRYAAKVVCGEREKRRGRGWCDEWRRCSMPGWSGAALGLKEQRWARDYFWGLPDLRFFNFDANLWPVDGPRQKIGSSKHRRTCVDMANTGWVSSLCLDYLLGRGLVQKCLLEHVCVQRKQLICPIGLVTGVERRRFCAFWERGGR